MSVNTNEITLKSEEKGTITYASDVIATIGGLAAIDVPGIAGMSGGFVDGIADLLGRKNFSKGIKVEMGTEEVAIDIAIIVEYGVPMGEVARNMQNSVKKTIETMTGLNVVEVNVHIQGINIEKEQIPALARPNPIIKPKVKIEEPPRVK